jgi:hypothetical protein
MGPVGATQYWLIELLRLAPLVGAVGTKGRPRAGSHIQIELSALVL